MGSACALLALDIPLPPAALALLLAVGVDELHAPHRPHHRLAVRAALVPAYELGDADHAEQLVDLRRCGAEQRRAHGEHLHEALEDPQAALLLERLIRVRVRVRVRVKLRVRVRVRVRVRGS